MPIITPYLLIATIGFSLSVHFGLLNPGNLILSYVPLKRLQLWRVFTSVLIFPLTPINISHYLINLYFLYSYSRSLEENNFNGRSFDYALMLIFNLTCCVLVGLIGKIPLLMDPMVMSIICVWCQLNKEYVYSIFAISIKATYFPWVLIVFDMLGGEDDKKLIGILVGYLYYFLISPNITEPPVTNEIDEGDDDVFIEDNEPSAD